MKPLDFWTFLELREGLLGKMYYFSLWLRAQGLFAVGLLAGVIFNRALPDWLILAQIWFTFNGFIALLLVSLEYLLFRALKRNIDEIAKALIEELEKQREKE
jgi:hypothetical protein